MPVPFLPQAAAQYPANADLSKQLMLLGDTIGQGIRGYRRQSLLSDLMTPGADGKVDYDKLAVGLLKMDEQQLAAIMANIGSGQFSRGIQTAQLGISQEQLKLAQAQSAIAQAGEARAAGKERREAGLFSEMFQPRTAQPGLLPAPPPATDPTMQFRPYPGPINAPAASPIAPSVSTMPAAPFAERFSGMPAPPQPGATPPQPQADTISGVPRREIALSMLGYGDAAKLMAEARKNIPENITRDILVRKEAERKAEIETERPAASARAINSIAELTKTGTMASDLVNHPGLWAATGYIVGRAPALTEAAANFTADLETVGIRIFITALQTMRELSKTGGAVGNVSDREGNRLEQSWRAITRVQSPDNMRKNLRAFIGDVNQAMTNISDAYQGQYGRALPFKKIPL